MADLVIDTSTLRLQVLLAARGGCASELGARLPGEAQAAAARLGPDGRVQWLVQIDDDPFPASNPLCRPFEAVLELEVPASRGARALADTVDGLGDRLADVVHPDLSGALLGAPQKLIPCAPTPLRFLYLMRRRAGTTHEQYVDYYFNNHSRFGFATPAIAGYTQFHVDAAASRQLCGQLGFGVWGADSVSELHMESLPAFFAATGDGRLGAEAAEDESRFVDRANSVSFCTRTHLPGEG